MSLYVRFAQLVPADGGAFALAIAQNRSSCDDAPFPQQLVSVAERTARPLGALAMEGSAEDAAGAAEAPVGVLVGAMMGGKQAVRVLDLARGEVLADRPAPWRFRGLALDAAGERLAFVLAERVSITEAATGREIASVPFATGRRFGAYLAWVRGGWAMAHARDRRWVVAPLSPDGLPAGEEHALRGEPDNLAGAAGARVVAAGIGKKLVEVVDLERGASVAVSSHSAKDAYAAVRVAVSADGARVLSRGTEDGRLCALPRGAAGSREIASLPTSRREEGGLDILTTPAFAVCGATLVTITDGPPSFHALGEDTAPVAEAWGPPPKARRAKR